MNYTGWWFQIFFIFIPTCGRFPIWLTFFRWVETTNQYTYSDVRWQMFQLRQRKTKGISFSGQFRLVIEFLFIGSMGRLDIYLDLVVFFNGKCRVFMVNAGLGERISIMKCQFDLTSKSVWRVIWRVSKRRSSFHRFTKQLTDFIWIKHNRGFVADRVA